ncbi:MAG TPA: methylenetetrahydrofolate--tRNA-(uracil(54)-C(5))-methyltransferase (FADH(2)-oxidizing) TrmFO [bacterium]|jgi:methylenetetrahydrofolate--tRNA-(uracil-5-)-methyltransferase
MKHDVHIIGAGLAGSEAALVAARNGLKVKLSEMRPEKKTPVHESGNFAEIVCSNSLGSVKLSTSSGCLKRELGLLSSPLIGIAKNNSVPAGHALAVDREKFATEVTSRIEADPNIEVIREEIDLIENSEDRIPTLVATGPLTSEKLLGSIAFLLGEENLYFFDAISPTIEADSIDMDIAFFGSRYDSESDDYLNCPFTREEYEAFQSAIESAERIEIRDFEPDKLFEGCLPVEIMAQRGVDAMRFGPLRPVGLTDPKTGKYPYAALQLRREQVDTETYSLVGFQTRLKYPEQKRIIRMIPGLQNAEFIRLGSMHRNSYLKSPSLLDDTLQFREIPWLFTAGCLSGVEGYVEDITTGHIAGINMVAMKKGFDLIKLPEVSMQGSLLRAITDPKNVPFHPTSATMGMLPPLEKKIRSKKLRREELSLRSLDSISELVSRLRNAGYIIPDGIEFPE